MQLQTRFRNSQPQWPRATRVARVELEVSILLACLVLAHETAYVGDRCACELWYNELSPSGSDEKALGFCSWHYSVLSPLLDDPGLATSADVTPFTLWFEYFLGILALTLVLQLSTTACTPHSTVLVIFFQFLGPHGRLRTTGWPRCVQWSHARVSYCRRTISNMSV